jgi:DNA-binding FadR family transcriptional regulator
MVSRAILWQEACMAILKPIESLTDIFVRVLRTDIVKGNLPIGSQLPSEGDLATQYGVSRTVIREGIRELVNAGMISKRQGQRSTVSPRADWNLMNLQVLAALLEHDEISKQLLKDLFTTRLLIECHAAAEASVRREEHDLRLMEQQLDIMRRAIDRPDVFVEADLEFHRLIQQASKNVVVSSLLFTISELLRVGRLFTVRSPEELRGLIDDHEELYSAIQHKDPSSARKAMSNHLLKIAEFVDMEVDNVYTGDRGVEPSIAP